MIVNGHDTETPKGRVALRRLIADARGLDVLCDLVGELAAPAEPGALKIQETLVQRLGTGDLLVPKQLTGDRLALLAGNGPALVAVAERLARRKAGEHPHPMGAHLLQRLGNTLWNDHAYDRRRDTHTNRERPWVRARRVADSGVDYQELASTDYPQVVQRAYATDWLAPLEVPRATLLTVLEAARQPASKDKPSVTGLSAGSLLARVQCKPGTDLETQSRDAVENVIKDAWTELVTRVEPEVLAAVELPEIMIYGRPKRGFRRDPDYPEHGASYCARTRTIHLLEGTTGTGAPVSYVTSGQLLHEFGHHIEEQGPVEIWCGLVSYLQHHSKGVLADPPRQRPTGEPTYDCLAADGFPLLKLGSQYGASYYADAGTELLALALQSAVLTSVPPKTVRLSATSTTTTSTTETGHEKEDTPYEDAEWDPTLLVLLLHAFRPGLMRKYGLAYPALLG